MMDLKFALRMLFKTPFVTTVAIISLALGIGANAAIFSLFDQVLLRPLPVQAPGQLVNLSAPGPKPGSQSCSQAGDCDDVFSYQMFRDLEHDQQVFTGIAAHRNFGASLAYKGQTLSSEGMLVSGSYFPVLGLTPALGRLLGPDDDRTIGESHVAVLAYDYWHTHFADNPAVLNDTLIINGQTMTIVGVAPRGFDGTTLGSTPRVFVPISMRGFMQPGFDGFKDRRSYWAYLFARLKPGVSIAQANSGLNGLYHSIVVNVEAPLQKEMSAATMTRFQAKTVEVKAGAQGQSTIRSEGRGALVLLLCVTAVVLIIACANIANLLLARSTARANEMAVRLSIGASRGQLIRQLLVESCLLAIMGGIAGLFVAHWTLSSILLLLPAETTQIISVSMDAREIAFASALSIGTGLLFGLVPAFLSTRPDLASTLKGTAGQPAGAGTAKWFRLALATVQIALSMTLLGAAGLFIKSLANVSHVDLGVKIDNVVTFGVSPELSGYTPERSKVLFSQMEERLGALPGVTGVTASLVAILNGDNWGSGVSVQGFPGGPDVDVNARYNEIGAGYFGTLGVPLISGREFTHSDLLGTAKVAIVNQAFAKKFKLGHDAVGKLMSSDTGNGAKLDTEIVGLVPDVKYSDVKDEVPPQFFEPYMQDKTVGSMQFYVRTSLDPAKFLSTLPPVMATIDPNLPIEELKTMPQQVKENVFFDRFISTLSAAFAGLATLLAAVGLYGVLAYTVAQRTREFGLRMALGAQPGRVRAMVLIQVGWMTLVGGAVGLGAALVLGRVAGSLLYQVKGYDVLALISSAALLAAVAFLAGLIPAMRASRIDPMRALRY